MQEDDQEIANLPLTERLHHKVWKVRLQAYEEISKQFLAASSPSDECFRIFLSDPTSLQKAVCDSNVAAQEAAISALLAFLEEGGPNACIRTRSTVVGPMAEKSLASTRAGTKRKAIDALLMYIELDTPDPIIEDLVPILSHKLPKLVAATAIALTEIYKAFGAKTVPPKPVTTALPKLFGHADKNVRAAAKGLSVELYKWLGDGLRTALFSNLKPVQQKELEEAFEQVKAETPHQERYLRSQQAAQSSQDSNVESSAEQIDAQIDQGDGYDLLEPVDAIKRLPSDYETRMASSKWKDRKECLDEVLIAVNIARIKDGDFNDLVRILAKSMKDANVGVVTVAAQCTECLARGLRSDFVRHVPSILPPTLERLKEKKQSVAEALGKSLDAIFLASSLSDILEDTLVALKHKTPQVRLESTKFLTRCLAETKVYPQKPEIKMIAEASVKLFGDTMEVNRTAAFEATGTLMKIIGEKQMSIYLEGVDDIKKNKLKEFYDKATVKAKAPKPAAPQATTTNAPTARGPVKKVLKAKKPQGASALANASSNSINAMKATTTSSIPPVTPKRAMSNLTHTPPSISSPAMAKRNTTSRISQPRIGASNLSSSIKPAGASTNLPSRRIGGAQGGAPASGLPSLSSPRPGRVRSTPQAGDSTQMNNQRLAAGSGIAMGLTRRTLAASAPANTNTNTAQQAKLDASLILAEKQELESLRAEKEEWEKSKIEWKERAENHQTDISKLTQEISDLQLRNAELLEEHTRDVLALKGKDSQVLRLKSDLDNEKARVNKLEAERHRLNAMLENSLASYNQMTETRPYSAPTKEESGISDIDQNDSYSINRDIRNLPRYDNAPNASEGGNWQRAGEVTVLLKDRIAALKAGRLKTTNSAR